MLLDLETDSVKELLEGGVDPIYLRTGHLLYVDASGQLWVVAFDADEGELTDEPVPGLGGVSVGATWARYSISDNGTLVYGAGGGAGGGTERRLLVVDSAGASTVDPLVPRQFNRVRWFPDGEWVAFGSQEAGDSDPDIFTYNIELGTTPKRLTFEGWNSAPVWSPSGERIAFASDRPGTDEYDLWVKNVTDDSPPEPIIRLPGNQIPTQWVSEDLILLERAPNSGPGDLWTVDLSGDSAVASPYHESEADIDWAVVSPSGDLAAIVSNESGQDEVYVRSFPVARQPTLVSRNGGTNARWSPDGNTIYYWTLGSGAKTLMAARVRRGPPFVVISRDSLFSGRYNGLHTDLHPDGVRWIVPQIAPNENVSSTEPAEERYFVIVNFFEQLRALLGN